MPQTLSSHVHQTTSVAASTMLSRGKSDVPAASLVTCEGAIAPLRWPVLTLQASPLHAVSGGVCSPSVDDSEWISEGFESSAGRGGVEPPSSALTTFPVPCVICVAASTLAAGMSERGNLRPASTVRPMSVLGVTHTALGRDRVADARLLSL